MGLPCGSDGVVQQHRDGHGTDAARHRRDGTRLFAQAFEIDVADQAVASFSGWVRNLVDPDVDDDSALSNHVRGEGVGSACHHHDDVGLTCEPRDVARAGVADGDRRVRPGVFF